MRAQFYTYLSILCFLPGLACHLIAQQTFNVNRTFEETNHQVVFASYSPDGQYIVTAGSDSSLIVWNTNRVTIHRTLTGLEARPNVAVFTADNSYVLSGGNDNKISIWDLRSIPVQIVKTFEEHRGPIKSLAISPDGRTIGSGSTDGTVRIWNIHSSSLVYEFKGHKQDVNAVIYSPDGKALVSGGSDGQLVHWNMENGSKLNSVKGHRGWIRDVAFNQDGNLLASCGDDKLIQTWDFPGFAQSGTFKGHKDWVQTIDFSPDGKNLVSGGRDRLILLWDVATNRLLHQSAKQGQIVTSLDISPARPNFISSQYRSEVLESWILSGLNDAQWDQRLASQAISTTVQSVEPADEDNSTVFEFFSPVPERGRVVHNDRNIDLIGRVSDPEGISIFLINKAVVELSESGVFQMKYELTRGENLFTMVVVNRKGKKNEHTLIVECTAQDARLEGDLVPVTSEGKYYALLVGINDYQHPDITDLDNPIKDAENLYNVLSSKYLFEKENIIFLKNPIQAELISSLDALSRDLTPEDNLLIFYAGHGYWDEKGKVGYWFPADASRNSTVNWFRNSTLRDFIGSFEAKHTLLIADACFSGAIFKTRAAFTDAPQGIETLYDLPSRKAMTSGILQEVPDESVFLKYLVKRLEENEEKYLTSEFLFSSFKTPVMNNSATVPQYGVIQNVGDEGGDFVFVRRE